MKIIIFAGGVGTRLWPLSRKNTPKQFGKIIGDYSTLQHTVNRLLPQFDANDIYIATGARYKDIVAGQLPEIPKENFIYEPEMRDNGPAIGLASSLLAKQFPDTPIAILWSDHMVKNEKAFRKALRTGEGIIKANEAKFVFIGQEPRFPNQNIGWIELGATNSFKRLVYRPGLTDAEAFLKSKNYVWNLGYFITTPRYLMDLFQKHQLEMYKQLCVLSNAFGSADYEKTLSSVYPQLGKISFDDAILQKMTPDNVSVISADLEWSDVGAWEALKEALSEKESENVVHGNVMLEDSRDSLVFNYNNQLCVGIDLNEMLVINTDDVLLICPKTSVPKIKKLVESLTGTSHEHLT